MLRVGLKRQLFGRGRQVYRLLFVIAGGEREPVVRIAGVRHAMREDYEEIRKSLGE